MDQESQQIDLAKKWELVCEHYRSMNVRFEKIPKPEVIEYFYKELQKFNSTFVRLVKEDPSLKEKTVESARRKSIVAPKPRLKIVDKVLSFLGRSDDKVSSNVESSETQQTGSASDVYTSCMKPTDSL